MIIRKSVIYYWYILVLFRYGKFIGKAVAVNVYCPGIVQVSHADTGIVDGWIQ